MKFIALFEQRKNFRVKWEYIETIPEFSALKDTKQSETWHKEGNAWEHTKRVVSELEKILNREGVTVGSQRWVRLIIAALCHDLGKPTTTKWDDEKKDYTTKCHGREGAMITRRLFFEEPVESREDVCYMVRHHMDLHHVFDKGDDVADRQLIRMSYGRVPVFEMAWLNEADSRGSVNDIEDEAFLSGKYEKIRKYADSLCVWNDRYRGFWNGEEIRKFFLNRDSDVPFIGVTEMLWFPKGSRTAFPTCYVMIGLPGAGKDTYIAEHLKEVNELCRDKIRTEIGIEGEKPMGNKEQEEEVTRIFNERMTHYIDYGEDFVVNNTMLRRQYREDVLKAIAGKGYRVIYIYVESPSVNENKRRRNGTIPGKVIDRMLSGFEFPEPWEYDKLIVSKQSEQRTAFHKYDLTDSRDKIFGMVDRLLGEHHIAEDYIVDLWEKFSKADRSTFVEALFKLLNGYYGDFNKLSLFHKKKLIGFYRKNSVNTFRSSTRRIVNVDLRERANNIAVAVWRNEQRNLNKVSMQEAKKKDHSLIPLASVLNELEVLKGAIILDGYEPEDSCIWFVNKLITELNENNGTRQHGKGQGA